MKYKVKVTVIEKKLYPELQAQYCADPNSGACTCYNVGDEFIFHRDDERDDFWHMGLNTPWPEGQKCLIVLRHGTLFPDISMLDFKAAQL